VSSSEDDVGEVREVTRVSHDTARAALTGDELDMRLARDTSTSEREMKYRIGVKVKKYTEAV
jgi:hypothetical protein